MTTTRGSALRRSCRRSHSVFHWREKWRASRNAAAGLRGKSVAAVGHQIEIAPVDAKIVAALGEYRCRRGSARRRPACRRSRPSSAPRDRPAARPAARRTSATDRREPHLRSTVERRTDRTRPSAPRLMSAPLSAWNVRPARVGVAPFAPQHLALARRQRAEKVIEGACSRHSPNGTACRRAAASPPRPVPCHSASVQNVTCTDDRSSERHACSSADASAAIGTPASGWRSRRGPGTGLNGAATCSFG